MNVQVRNRHTTSYATRKVSGTPQSDLPTPLLPQNTTTYFNIPQIFKFTEEKPKIFTHASEIHRENHRKVSVCMCIMSVAL